MPLTPIQSNIMLSIVNETSVTTKRETACKWLCMWLQLKHSLRETGAVIFDIDATLVDEKEDVIECTREVFETCVRLKFVPVLITARPDFAENRHHTMAMLKRLNLMNFERMFMMPSSLKPTMDVVSEYKRAARNDVAKSFSIVANIGDMWTDHVVFPLEKSHVLHGKDATTSCIFFPEKEHGEVCIKLPAIIPAA